MYIPKTVQEENVHSNCLIGLIFSTSWRVAPTKKKIPYGDLDFLNFVCKSIGSSVGKNFDRARSARGLAAKRQLRKPYPLKLSPLKPSQRVDPLPTGFRHVE